MSNSQQLQTVSIALSLCGMLGFGSSALADEVFLDDVIIVGSACVGFDCADGESFGFDTLRLKENNLRLDFWDTSSTASFPNNRWKIVINDSSNGGANHFTIQDVTGGRDPVRIFAGAPTSSLVVNSSGNIGFGTATPVVELHAASGDTPTLRLEQNGSSGFTPQTWDVAGNEVNFFVRDATNGSRLPFRIRPSAPTSSIDIATDGDVGLGTGSPVANVDIFRSGNQTTVQAALRNSTADWRLQNFQDNFRITLAGTGTAELTSKGNGNLVLGGTCIEFDGGGTPFMCTFSAGAAPSCVVGSCP